MTITSATSAGKPGSFLMKEQMPSKRIWEKNSSPILPVIHWFYMGTAR